MNRHERRARAAQERHLAAERERLIEQINQAAKELPAGERYKIMPAGPGMLRVKPLDVH